MASAVPHHAPDGTVETVDGKRVLHFKRYMQHQPEKIWHALTEPELLATWLAEAELQPAVGGAVKLRWLNTGTVAVGTVTAYEKPRLLEFDTDVHGRLRWELTPAPGGCRLVFTATGDIPDDVVADRMAGWHLHLELLDEALGGHPVNWNAWPQDRWDAHKERYSRG